MLEYIQSRSLSYCNSIKHLSSLPSTQLFPTLSWKTYYGSCSNCVSYHQDARVVLVGGCIFQQTFGIPMGTNCAPLLADWFLSSHKADSIHEIIKKNVKKLARSFNFTFHYIDDVLSRLGDFVDSIYPIELGIRDTTNIDRSASYLDIHLKIDSEGRLRTKLYDKRDDFNFPIVNFPFMCSNISATPAYGVYISQLIHYSRACGSYQDFLDRTFLLTRKLLNQELLLFKLKSSRRKFYGCHLDMFDSCGISVSQTTTDMFHLS